VTLGLSTTRKWDESPTERSAKCFEEGEEDELYPGVKGRHNIGVKVIRHRRTIGKAAINNVHFKARRCEKEREDREHRYFYWITQLTPFKRNRKKAGRSRRRPSRESKGGDSPIHTHERRGKPQKICSSTQTRTLLRRKGGKS